MSHFDGFRTLMSRGDDKQFEVRVIDPDTEAPLSLDGWTKFYFTAKADPGDADVDAQIQLTTDLGEGLTVTDAEGGIIHGHIVPGMTEDLDDTDHLYYCDLQGIDPGGRVKTILRGLLTVEADITRSTS